MKPISVYLDTNILNYVAPKAIDWLKTDWGRYLKELTNNNTIQVQASPTNCIEIAINKDLEHRNNQARALNTLIKGQHMDPPYEFSFIEEFLSHIESNWPGSTNFPRLLSSLNISSVQYVALLGQMAALKDFDCTKGFSGILKPKIISHIIQANILENPRTEIEMRLGIIPATSDKHEQYLAYDAMGIDDLTAIQQEKYKKKYPVDKSAVTLLKKRKSDLIDIYMLDELRSSILQVFNNLEDLIKTINFDLIVKEWTTVHTMETKGNSKYSVKPLSKEINERYAASRPFRSDPYDIIAAIADRFYHFSFFSKCYVYNMINEMEKSLNEGKLPTWGLVLDCQHILMPMKTDIFLCNDDRLLNTCKTLHKQLPAIMYRETAASLDEFKRKIESRLNKLKSNSSI